MAVRRCKHSSVQKAYGKAPCSSNRTRAVTHPGRGSEAALDPVVCLKCQNTKMPRSFDCGAAEFSLVNVTQGRSCMVRPSIRPCEKLQELRREVAQRWLWRCRQMRISDDTLCRCNCHCHSIFNHGTSCSRGQKVCPARVIKQSVCQPVH
jgi:hypothetical protein